MAHVVDQESPRLCVICAQPIPGAQARYRAAKTCSAESAGDLARQRKALNGTNLRHLQEWPPPTITPIGPGPDRLTTIVLALASVEQRVQLRLDGVTVVVGPGT